jgi:iron complex outermembrane receptor protein
MLKKVALASTSLAWLLLAPAAWAQDDVAPQDDGARRASDPAAAPNAQEEEAPSSGIAEIVVTATRQATNLQDTPVAITAVTAEALEARGITNMGELSSVVPNAQFRRVQGAFGPGVSAFIRGIGSGDTGLGAENPVAFYIDDVYYPILLGANFDLLDINHIEVLRGPQGTLFGRNTLAGAINIVARQPELGELSGYGEVTVGSYDRRDLRAGFNLPLGDNAALLVSGLAKNQTGYQQQLDFTCEMNRRGTPELAGSFPVTGPLQGTSSNNQARDCVIGHYGGTDVYGTRGSIMWEPIPSLQLTLTGDYIKDESDNPADSIVDIDPTRANANLRSQAAYFGLVWDQRFRTGDPYTTYVTYTDRIAACTVIPGNTYYNGNRSPITNQCTRGGYELPNQNNYENWGVAAKFNWDLGSDIELTGVFAHREMDEIHTFDTDGTPLLVEHVINNLTQSYDHAELRLSGTSDLVDWVGGLFYFKADGEQFASLIQGSSGLQRSLHNLYKPESKAAFASATIRPFGPRVGIVLGGRYAEDEKEVNFSNVSDLSPAVTSSDIVFTVVPQQKKFSWKAGLNWQPNDNILLYGSAATGYTLPGFNPRPLQFTQVAQFEGNENIAYELGAKLDLLDRRLRLNLAGFYTDFNNRPTAIGGAEALLNDQASRRWATSSWSRSRAGRRDQPSAAPPGCPPARASCAWAAPIIATSPPPSAAWRPS